jgi:hypothetical protein
MFTVTMHSDTVQTNSCNDQQNRRPDDRMDPRHHQNPAPFSILDQSSHVHLQEPQIDSRLVALKEVA